MDEAQRAKDERDARAIHRFLAKIMDIERRMNLAGSSGAFDLSAEDRDMIREAFLVANQTMTMALKYLKEKNPPSETEVASTQERRMERSHG